MQTQTPYGSPDSLRQFLQLRKQFYNLHVTADTGFEDCDGLQYSSSIQNFGAEILLESRKMRMRRPPVPIVKPNRYFSYYFNITYSDYIDSYEQSNMLMGCVKSNTMMSNHTYQLLFEDCEIVNVIRSNSYSDKRVHVTKFYRTTTDPKLVIDDSESYDIQIASSLSDNKPTWYFAINSTTDGLYEATEVGSGFQIKTTDLKQYVDLPFIWVCDPQLNMFPPFKWKIKPIGSQMRDLFKFAHGMDGNGVDHLYPLTYSNYPSGEVWYIKAHGYFNNNPTDERNFGVQISRIEFVHVSDLSFTMEPIESFTFEPDDEFTKLTLHKYYTVFMDSWEFRIPQEGDYDYDAVTYNNPMVACAWLHHFSGNQDPENHLLLAAFNVINKNQYFNRIETEINQARFGVHLDNTAASSKHTVDKHYTIVNDLSKFDGIPLYFGDADYRTDMGYNTHHTHMELYAIRDDANDPITNEHPMDRQTAAIIIDSGIPINDTHRMPSNTKPVIVYDLTHAFQKPAYKTNSEYIISTVNYLSTIGYVDDAFFGDTSIEKYAKASRFIYHGNGYFSLGMVDIGSDNYGRCYLLTNDPASYENNATAKNKKASATAARVCDIPTSFTQLQNIEGQSPTLLIDPFYVRQKASFGKTEYLKLWNEFVSRCFKTRSNPIYESIQSLVTSGQDQRDVMLQNGDISFNQITVIIGNGRNQVKPEINNAGTGYAIGDQFGFNVCGIFLRGVVDTVTTDENHGIETFTLSIDTTVPGYDGMDYARGITIPIENFKSSQTFYELNTLTGTGHDATIQITIPNTKWGEYQIYQSRYRLTFPTPSIGSIYAFLHYKNYDGISVIGYNTSDPENCVWDESTVVQLTGDLEVGDPYYDDPSTQKKRTVENSFMYNILNNQNYEDDHILDKISGGKSIDVQYKRMQYDASEGITVEKIISNEDLHQIMNDCGMNTWNSFLALVPSSTSITHFYAIAWMYDMNASYYPNENQRNNHNLIIPSNSSNHINDYDDSWSKIKFNVINGKIIPYMYDIMHKTIDSYSYDNHVLKKTDETTTSLRNIIATIPSSKPSDVREILNGNTLNYNLYRYNHFDKLNEINRLRNTYYQMTSSELYDLAINMYGNDTIVSRYYSYTTHEYQLNTYYTIGSLITKQTTMLNYEMRHVYGGNLLIVDTTTNEVYRSLKPFVSAYVQVPPGEDEKIYLRRALEQDIGLRNIEYVSQKPDHPVYQSYRALTSFTSSSVSIDEDIENGNLQYIGPFTLSQNLINYIIQNMNTNPHVYDTGSVILNNELNETPSVPEDNPIGGFVPLLDTIDDMNTVNGRRVNTDPLYVFRLYPKDENSFNVNTLNELNYRVYDGDVDISLESMLMVKVGSQYRQYIFNGEAWEWNY